MFEIELEKLGLYQLGVERGKEQGIEQGLEQGLEQGIEQGLEQGLEKGSERRQQQIVLHLLSKFSPEQAAEFSGVSLDEVNLIAASGKAR